jgi:acetyltransferase-like isoleucine patch superfamily enzyme
LNRIKSVLKTIAQAIALACMSPLAAMSAWGRLAPVFEFGAHVVALIPGLPGHYLRAAYYFMTLRESALSARISFGSVFAQSSSRVGRDVYIGAYCVLGACEIGERTRIASHVQILSGRHQHARDDDSRLMGTEAILRTISIGADCWLGASSVIMADVGAQTTIGAGAVVPHPIPPNVVAVGNPSRIVRHTANPARIATHANG